MYYDGPMLERNLLGGIYDPPRKPKLVADSGLLVADVVSGLLVLVN